MRTMTQDKLLKEKAQAKARKPAFSRTDSHKKAKLGNAWRKPKGYQNKMRLTKKGYKVSVKPGYGTPTVLKGTARGTSLTIVSVHNEAELAAIDPKTQAAEIAGVGRKKKEALITLALEKKISLVNLSVVRYQEKTKKILEDKAAHKKTIDEKTKQREEKEKAAEKEVKKEEQAKKEKKEEPANEEDKKDQEKKEKDKVLTSKNAY